MLDYATLSDTDLITLLRNRDKSAYTEIYKRYYYLVFVQAYKKLRDEERVKDMVQELFIDLWLKRERIFANNLAGYLVTSVKNKVINFIVHQQVESKYILSINDYTNTGKIAHTDYLIREKQLQSYIEREIQALPKKMRRVFELSRFTNLTNKEISQKLNTTEGNVSNHIQGAIKILRTKLGTMFTLL